MNTSLPDEQTRSLARIPVAVSERHVHLTQTIIEQLPEAATKFSAALVRLRVNQFGNMQKVQTAASEVEKAASQAAGG